MSWTLPVPFRIIAVLVVFVMTGHIAQGQSPSFGIKGGLVTTDDMKKAAGGGSESRMFTFGPTVEVPLSMEKLAFEATFLYRRVGYNSYYSPTWWYENTSQVRGNLFEVPLMLKYYPQGYNAEVPFYISGGFVFRFLAGAKNKFIALNYVSSEWVSTGEGNVHADGGPFGVSIGTGIRFGKGRMRFSPEFRYTEWFSPLFEEESGYYGGISREVVSSTHKFEIMFNLSFVTSKIE